MRQFEDVQNKQHHDLQARDYTIHGIGGVLELWRSRWVVANDPFLTAVGENIRAARKAAKLSQADVERLCGVRQHRLSEIESGRRAMTLRTLLALAQALKIQPRKLIPVVEL